jgi:hypothetical protein
MTKFGIYKPLLAAPHGQCVMAGLQVVQQMRAFVDDNVTVGIGGLVGGPSNVRKVSREAVASYLNIFWLEPMIPEQGPQNPPRRAHEIRGQFCVYGRPGPLDVQNEGSRNDLAQCNFLPMILHKALYHRLDASPNYVRGDLWC